MKEIKFRAWNKTTQKMTYSDNWQLKEQPFEYIYEFFNESESVEFMQYTGLTDCEGNEIYEGDILSDGCNAHETIGVVIFKNGSFYLEAGDYLSSYLHVIDLKFGYKKIGNKFEDPSLVKEVK